MAQSWPKRSLTPEVALLCERDPQVTVLPAKAVCEEGREGSCMLLQELEPRGQPLQRQGREEALAIDFGRYVKWPSCGELGQPELPLPQLAPLALPVSHSNRYCSSH